MERLQAFLETLIIQHEALVKNGADWGKESYCLGRISAIRTAMIILDSPGSTIPPHLIYKS